MVRDVLCSFKSGGAESVYGRGGSGIREAGSESGGTDEVGCSSFGDLFTNSSVYIQEPYAPVLGTRKEKTYIATANILHKLRIQFRLLNNLLQQRVNQVIQLCILESSFKTFG